MIFKDEHDFSLLPKILFMTAISCASPLIEQGENIKYIQSQLGHSNPAVTLNVYAHLMNKTNPVSALRLEKSIFQTGSKMVAKPNKGLQLKP